MRDRFGRNINYLRISVTDLCNLRCIYCMPEEGVRKMQHEDILRFEEILHIVNTLVKLGITKVRITGGEPLVRRGITGLIKKIGALSGIKDLSMTTNGILLKQYAQSLRESGLGRINISLDTLDDSKYRYITRGGNINDVLQGLKEVRKLGFHPVKLNFVLIRDFNDDEIEDFAELTYQGINVRFIELMPGGCSASWASDRFLSNDSVLERIKGLVPVKNEDASSSSVNYRLEGANADIGLISPISCRFCADCNRIRLTSDGRLYTCLHSDDHIDLRSIIRKGEDISGHVLDFVYNKPASHRFDENIYMKGNMVQIGG